MIHTTCGQPIEMKEFKQLHHDLQPWCAHCKVIAAPNKITKKE